jgi:hypothetical protein
MALPPALLILIPKEIGVLEEFRFFSEVFRKPLRLLSKIENTLKWIELNVAYHFAALHSLSRCVDDRRTRFH